jgi:YegS/Rv2252/BmrU family lipid kinase
MPADAALIVNPYAGRWRARRLVPVMERTLREAGLHLSVHVSTHIGEGIALARQAAEAGIPLVIAAGGDGTVNEVVNGLMTASRPATLGVLPVGTGNDFATMLGLPLELGAACQALAERSDRVRQVDVGRVLWESGQRYFANNSGLGLEAAVSVENDRLVRMKGKLRYIVAALKGIARARPWDVDLEWAAGRYHGPVTLLSVGNTRRTGGAFYLTPHARPDDGLFDFLYGYVASRLRLLHLLPMALQGKHIHEPEMNVDQSPQVRATLNPGTPVQCDGEVVALGARQVEYELLPGRLAVAAAG